MPDDPAVIDYHGRHVVKCANCQTLYDAIGKHCPACKSRAVLQNP